MWMFYLENKTAKFTSKNEFNNIFHEWKIKNVFFLLESQSIEINFSL